MASLINSAGATGTGSMTIQGPNTNSNQVLTIPDATGTAMVSGNMPAFSAYFNGSQSVTVATFTKFTANTKSFDTANCYNTSTYRFTPTVAGYYQFTFNVLGTGTGLVDFVATIYKNGANAGYGAFVTYGGGVSLATILLYMNGTTDYVEPYVFINAASSASAIGDGNSYGLFQGCLVRAA